MRLRVALGVLLGSLPTGLAGPPSVLAQETPIAVEAVLARSIHDRMPVDTGSVFQADVGTVWLWSRVTGATGQTISHVWMHGEDEWPVRLEIRGSPWRTFSSKEIPPEWRGNWRVEIRDQAGRVLQRLLFVVRP